MEISGIIKNSFVDYPGNIACVIFTPGCNFNCWYCHNFDLIKESKGQFSEQEVLELLNNRQGFIDGVVITGGEPTMQSDLFEFVCKIKKLGYKIKLDTNGTNLQAVKKLVEHNMLNYIAMDVKAPLRDYGKVTTVLNINEIKETINYIKNCGVDYEFRTTFAPNLTPQDIEEIVNSLGNVSTYSLQQYQKPEHITKEILVPHAPSVFLQLKEKLQSKVGSFIIRNL